MPVVPGTYWDQLERVTTPKQRRTQHAKVRSGCITCKKRRVKCDEAKPSCARCAKTARACEGYEEPRAKAKAKAEPEPEPAERASASRRPHERSSKNVPRARAQTLQPKPILPASARGKPEEDRSGGVVLLSGFRVSAVPFHLDARDAAYFDRFRHQIVEDMSSWSTTSRMSLLLKEALYDECVRHAVLGLAAMSHALDDAAAATTAGQSGGGDYLSSSLQSHHRMISRSSHHKVALQHYMKAITLCRKQLAGAMTEDTALSSLGAALVFACIELLQGDVAAADQILSSGLKLLEDVKGEKYEATKALQFGDELAQLEYCFDRMAIGCGTSPFFKAQREMYKIVKVAPHDYIPGIDADLSTLRTHWTRFQKGVSVFMLSAYSGMVMQPGAEAQNLKEQARYLCLVRQWAPVLDTYLRREKDNQVIRLLMTMKVLAMVWDVYLSCGLDHFNVAYDSCAETFREVTALVEKYFAETNRTEYARFNLDVVLFSAMCFVILACREKETRYYALSVFDKLTCQEACWGNAGMFKALRALADLEEQGRDENGHIPLASRCAFLGCDWDFEHRRTLAKFVPVIQESSELNELPVTYVPLDY